MIARTRADDFLDSALDALAFPDASCNATLDALPVPVYTTDIEGNVTYWNRACVEFAGRRPELGQDRWCVTWRIHTTAGKFVPHD
ncbi:MAG: PAS domain-containing protein [Sphingomicrobium sp.]